MLSPFMPFLTEEIWHALYDGKPPAKSIALTRYPHAGFANRDFHMTIDMEALQRLVVEIRALRKEIGVDEKLAIPVVLDLVHYASPEDLALIEQEGLQQQDFIASVAHSELRQVFESNRDIVARLAKVSELIFSSTPLSGPNKRGSIDFDLQIVYERTVDAVAERDRLTKDIAKYEKGLAAAERQLGNEGFLAKAPAQVVEGLKKQEAETRLLLEKARAALEALPNG